MPPRGARGCSPQAGAARSLPWARAAARCAQALLASWPGRQEAKLCLTPQLSLPGRTGIQQASVAGHAGHSPAHKPPQPQLAALLLPGERQHRRLREQQAKAGLEPAQPSCGCPARDTGPGRACILRRDHGIARGRARPRGRNSLLELQGELEGSASSSTAPALEEGLCSHHRGLALWLGPGPHRRQGHIQRQRQNLFLAAGTASSAGQTALRERPHRGAAQPHGDAPVLPGACQCPREGGGCASALQGELRCEGATGRAGARSQPRAAGCTKPATAAGRGCHGE